MGIAWIGLQRKLMFAVLAVILLVNVAAKGIGATANVYSECHFGNGVAKVMQDGTFSISSSAGDVDLEGGDIMVFTDQGGGSTMA